MPPSDYHNMTPVHTHVMTGEVEILRNQLKETREQLEDLTVTMTTSLKSVEASKEIQEEYRCKVEMLMRQRDEMVTESREELSNLRCQAVALQELLTKERNGCRAPSCEAHHGTDTGSVLSDSSTSCTVTEDQEYRPFSPTMTLVDTGVNTDPSLFCDDRVSDGRLLLIESKLLKSQQVLEEKEREVTSRKRACETLRNECNALNKANEAFKRVIKSLQSGMERFQKESVSMQGAIQKLKERSDSQETEIERLTTLLGKARGESEGHLMELKRLSQVTASIQGKLDASNLEGRKMKSLIAKQKEDLQHVEAELLKAQNKLHSSTRYMRMGGIDESHSKGG